MSSRSSSLIEGLPRQSLTDRAAPMRLASASAGRPCRTEKAEPAPAARASFRTGRLDEHRPYQLLGGGAALIRRVGNDVLGVGPQPQIVGDDLNDVANQLIARHKGRT